MVVLSLVVFGRPPHLIYGVKRGKVPSSLRPNVIMKKQALGNATCTEEMSRLMNCFKRENFQDSKCSKEIQEFQDCANLASKYRMEKKSTQSGWTLDELNRVMRENTQVIKKSRVRS
ncbi:coiled-coil-helix-coiled-coil-helix domain-containing protein 1-like [Xenia sp. Carnegie-2017]|uniref:coiled-coil-helix-coiled-coil-helix domain-containing protein 1-like n=1 Tax=Xenia sp. Carnegie-2017 TaxID=2897299 RepID=UPI001F041EAC|nr:coiled-coil-helix-coiled-coil-helix domain-containing protein 1-like [Xenia sp. Carnegie-2017]